MRSLGLRVNTSSKIAPPTRGGGLEHRSIRFQSPRSKPRHHALDTQAYQGPGWGGGLQTDFFCLPSLLVCIGLRTALLILLPQLAGHHPILSTVPPLLSREPGRSAACTSQSPLAPSQPSPAWPVIAKLLEVGWAQRHLTASPSHHSLLMP